MARIGWLVLSLAGATTVVGHDFPIVGRSAPAHQVVPGAAAMPGPITPERACRIVPGMTLKEVERVLGPARVEPNRSCLPLYPPGSVVMTNNGPLYADRQWVSGAVAITVRVNNQSKCVKQVWISLPGAGA